MTLPSAIEYSKIEMFCPHCDEKLRLCHAPPVHVGDGLGWGSEYLFICLNNDCPLFVNGWKQIENNYGHVGSYRYMRLPNSKEEFNMMVAGKEAFTGSEVDVEALMDSNERYRKIKESVKALDTCVEEGNLQPVIHLITCEHANIEDRKKAIKLLVDVNDLDCIEPLRNHEFRDQHLEQEVNLAIMSLLAKNFLKECPYCAELVKARAKVCKHCKEELS